MNFQQFEEVSILNESGLFRVLRAEGLFLYLEDEHGFERKVSVDFVVRRKQIQVNKVPFKDDVSATSSKKSNKNEEIPSIDLHHHELNLDERFLSKHDILTAQTDAFKRFCNQMIQTKVKRFRVVHGIGEGRLKTELRVLVQGQAGLSMHDDQVTRGKVGASLIEIQTSVARPF
ncbi:MAG: hypothetical protein RLZZ243_966 [Bacteroidota bacterium]|jgi:hypothetical protein